MMRFYALFLVATVSLTGCMSTLMEAGHDFVDMEPYPYTILITPDAQRRYRTWPVDGPERNVATDSVGNKSRKPVVLKFDNSWQDMASNIMLTDRVSRYGDYDFDESAYLQDVIGDQFGVKFASVARGESIVGAYRATISIYDISVDDFIHAVLAPQYHYTEVPYAPDKSKSALRGDSVNRGELAVKLTLRVVVRDQSGKPLFQELFKANASSAIFYGRQRTSHKEAAAIAADTAAAVLALQINQQLAAQFKLITD